MILKDSCNEIKKYVSALVYKTGAKLEDSYIYTDTEKFEDSISIYFTISYGLARRKIRISNHTRQHKNVPDQKLLKSMTVNKKTSYKDIEKFVINRINELKRGSLYAAFDYIKKCA